MHFELSPLIVWIALWIVSLRSKFQENNNDDITKCHSFGTTHTTMPRLWQYLGFSPKTAELKMLKTALILYYTIPTFNDPQTERPFENIVGKGENAGNQHFLLYPQCFLLFPKQISTFKLFLFCFLQMLSVWISPKICRSVTGYTQDKQKLHTEQK